MKKIITYGTFDMLHIGHINLLTRAKARGDYLIVGVTSDDYDRSRNKLNVVQSQEERVSAIRKLAIVDEVILETHKTQKQEDMLKYDIDEFVIGDDWVGYFDYLNEYTNVIYLPRTEGISSTQIRNESIAKLQIGVVNVNRDSYRFIKELYHVGLANLSAIYDKDIDIKSNELELAEPVSLFESYNTFLNSNIDAIYISGEINDRYLLVKRALQAGKHVLCENPFSIKLGETEELFHLAREHNLLLLLALKTAFTPAFNKLLQEINKGIIGEIRDIRSTFTSLYREKGFDENYIKNGATNLLMSYPSLIVQKIAGSYLSLDFYDQMANGYDTSNIAITRHHNQVIGIASVGIESKSDGSAIISGTKGYAYIPAPWWLTKEFYFKFEDASKEIKYEYEFEGDGLRYMISAFASLIRRNCIESEKLTINDMIEISNIIVTYNEWRAK